MNFFRIKAGVPLSHATAGRNPSQMVVPPKDTLDPVALAEMEGCAKEFASGDVGDCSGDVFKEIHEFFANFTVFLVVLHVAGVIVESLIHGENLVSAMWHGYKRKAN